MINITLKIELPEYVNPTHADLTPEGAVALAADYDALVSLRVFADDLRRAVFAQEVRQRAAAEVQAQLF